MFKEREVTIDKVVWNGEENVEFHFTDSSIWGGAKLHNFWSAFDDDGKNAWKDKLVPGSKLRLWTVQWSTVVGFEWANPDNSVPPFKDWIPVWCAANQFQKLAERKERESAYVKEIEDCSKLIVKALDEGKTPEEAIKSTDERGITGNMQSWAVRLAIRDSSRGPELKTYWNKLWGKEDAKGVINPAVITIKK